MLLQDVDLADIDRRSFLHGSKRSKLHITDTLVAIDLSKGGRDIGDR